MTDTAEKMMSDVHQFKEPCLAGLGSDLETLRFDTSIQSETDLRRSFTRNKTVGYLRKHLWLIKWIQS